MRILIAVLAFASLGFTVGCKNQLTTSEPIPTPGPHPVLKTFAQEPGCFFELPARCETDEAACIDAATARAQRRTDALDQMRWAEGILAAIAQDPWGEAWENTDSWEAPHEGETVGRAALDVSEPGRAYIYIEVEATGTIAGADGPEAVDVIRQFEARATAASSSLHDIFIDAAGDFVVEPDPVAAWSDDALRVAFPTGGGHFARGCDADADVRFEEWVTEERATLECWDATGRTLDCGDVARLVPGG